MADGLPEGSSAITETRLRLPGAAAEIIRFVQPGPFDRPMQPVAGYRLDLCLTPRPVNARACFPDKWGPLRFEPLGELFLVPPGWHMHVRGDSGRQVSVVCELEREGVERWLDGPIDWTDRRLAASLDVASPRLKTLLGWLAEEMYRPPPDAAPLADLIAGQLAIEVGRYLASIEDGPATGGLGAWRLRVIDERLRKAGPPPTLRELAGLCNLSVRQLTRAFRASRGCSINDHVSHGRIEGAKRLLATDGSIKSIAFATGFASPSSFAFAFRRATGITPRQFRQRMGPRGGPD